MSKRALISLLVLLAGAEFSEESWHSAAGSILSLDLNHLQNATALASASVSNHAEGLQFLLTVSPPRHTE